MAEVHGAPGDAAGGDEHRRRRVLGAQQDGACARRRHRLRCAPPQPRFHVPLPTLCCVVGMGGIVLAQLLALTPALCRKTCHVIAHASPREVPEEVPDKPCEGMGAQESEGSAYAYGPWLHAVYIFLEVGKLKMLIQVAVWGLWPAFALASRLLS
eukprot:jgi/Mesen1/7926/ME000422S07080